MADDDKQPRRVKVTGAAAHRTGERRAAIKPHKSTGSTSSASAPSAPSVSQIIADYLGKLRAGSLSQTFTGETLVKNATLIRSAFGLAANDELYLLTDPTKSGKAGLLLSSSGLSVADGRGGTGNVAWKDFGSLSISAQRGAVIIGQTGITTSDAQAIAGLLQQIQAKLA